MGSNDVDREALANLFSTHLGEWQARWWGLIDAVLAARGDAAPTEVEWGVRYPSGAVDTGEEVWGEWTLFDEAGAREFAEREQATTVQRDVHRSAWREVN